MQQRPISMPERVRHGEHRASSICSGAPASAPARTRSTTTRRLGFAGAVSPAASTTRTSPTTSTSRSGSRGTSASPRAAQFLPDAEHHRRAPALAVPHGAQRSARSRRRWRSSGTTTSRPPTRRSPARSAPTEGTRYMAAKPSEDPAGVQGQIELFREHALGNFRDLLVDVAKDPAMLVWLDGRTNVQGAAAGELRARADGAVHDGRRHVHGDRRLRRRARVHRLEPDARRPRHGAARTTSSSTTPASTTRRRRSSRSRSTPTAAARFRRASADAGMQDGLDLINAVARASGDRPAARAQAVRVLRQRGRTRRTQALIDDARADLLRRATSR